MTDEERITELDAENKALRLEVKRLNAMLDLLRLTAGSRGKLILDILREKTERDNKERDNK
jgi:hypothetical protein